MATLIRLDGPPAFSRARLDRWSAELERVQSDIGGLYAQYVHFLVVGRPFDEAEARLAHELLAYGPTRDLPRPLGVPRALVVPRQGTLSPWSSKATDIFHRCGMDFVQRVERGVWWYSPVELNATAEALLFDRMTQQIAEEDRLSFLDDVVPRPLQRIALGDDPSQAIGHANETLGLALSGDEVDYLAVAFRELDRDPTDVELMMFAQANSEHCRHKIFNAQWTIDGERADQTLFGMIRHTHQVINGRGVLSAYADNAAVIEGGEVEAFGPDAEHAYRRRNVGSHILMKVETHNHPTAIAPFPGAATGSGGEIRDEGAVGRGSKPKAGLCGFTTSHLRLSDALEPWEIESTTPDRLASAESIMLDGPLGAAAFNNEFGRPCLTGYFRTFESRGASFSWGYHKPVMVAGGLGSIRTENVLAADVPVDAPLVVLGGPAMLIGLGGGAASSVASGASASDLDFASVQRDNAEMQRRCQEVIDRATALGEANPIRLIHDVGAGGLSNAFPELVNDAGRGARFDIRKVPAADRALSPMELWCNESQERYVLAIDPERFDVFTSICERERCPYATVGVSTADRRLIVNDSELDGTPVDMPLATLLGKPPRMDRAFRSTNRDARDFDLADVACADAIDRVLRFPAVGSKKFLITIGDRSITGLVARDQMVGPHQVPVADVAVTLAGYSTFRGEAMAMGERSPVAVIDPPAAARLAVGEALTNLCAANVADLSRVVLSANWMAAAGFDGEDEALFRSVEAVGREICPALGIAIPVGKDSLSMRTATPGGDVVSPVTLNVTAFAPVDDVRRTLTPEAQDADAFVLLALDEQHRLGGSALAQVYGALGACAPDVDDSSQLRVLLHYLLESHSTSPFRCYHDRSDGGLVTALFEIAFASRCGLDISTVGAGTDALAELFAEEIGVVVGVAADAVDALIADATARGLSARQVAARRADQVIRVASPDGSIFEGDRVTLERTWSWTSFEMQRRRDDPACADEEFDLIGGTDPGVRTKLTFDPDAPFVIGARRPAVAVLREQGVNGQVEMAAAFDTAGFDAVDVHMSDLVADPDMLMRFQALAACGGFSYGDVLGGGGGWAKSIAFSERLSAAFRGFFERDTLTLGICNGCQMLAQLRDLVPGGAHWPRFVGNRSERFEARTVLVRINAVASPWLADMAGSVIPVPVAHGEGRAELDEGEFERLRAQDLVALQYVDGHFETTMHYPLNPNGSTGGVAGLISGDGRALVMMPHPERVFRSVQNSVLPHAGENGPWLNMFRNAARALR